MLWQHHIMCAVVEKLNEELSNMQQQPSSAVTSQISNESRISDLTVSTIHHVVIEWLIVIG